MKRTTKHVFAVIRLDRFQTESIPAPSCITVKEVVTTKEKAQSEVERLNAINQGKGCEYFWQITRLVD